MNIHPISNDLWMRRQREVAPALTKVVEDSVSSALIDEQNATIEAGQDNRISVASFTVSITGYYFVKV